MDRIEKQIISYKEVRQGIDLGQDPEGIGAYALREKRLKTLLNNPNLDDDNSPMIAFTRVDGCIWGRCMYFPTRIKISNSIEKSLGGSSLMVNEKGRKESLGVDLMMLPMHSFDAKYLLYASVSEMALPLYKKLKFEVFELPRRWQLRNSKPILQRIGFKGLLLSVSTFLSNLIIVPFNYCVKRILKFSVREYEIKQLEEVPDWVIKQVENDNHKYAEYHDKKWFEWVLNNCFRTGENNIQKLYGIYKENKPVGFLLIKERQCMMKESNIDSVTFGSVVEWGTDDNGQLDEYTINKIALLLYSKKVDIAQVISSDYKMVDQFRKFAIFRHGSSNVVFKDLTKELEKDYKDPNNWRLRFGYSDAPFN